MACKMTIYEAEQILHLVEPYNLDDLSKCYRTRAKKAHPDLGGSEEEMRQVNEAYDCLKPLFDNTNADIKRSPLTKSESEQNEWVDFGDDFDDFIDAINHMYYTQQHNERVNDYVSQTVANGQSAKDNSTNSEDEFVDSFMADSEKVPVKFRHKLSKFFLGLRHVPYGFIAWCFLMWGVLTTSRPMDSMADGIGIFFDMLFEAAIVVPILVIIIRTVIRKILFVIAQQLAK